MNADQFHEAEKYVVGAALRNPDIVRDVIETGCTPDDFASPMLARIFDVIIGMRSAGTPVDELTVEHAATERNLRGITRLTLFDLKAEVPVTSNAPVYARKVREGGIRRRLVETGTRFVQLADHEGDIDEVWRMCRGEWDHVRGEAITSHRPKTLGEILAGEDDYDWLIPDLLERGDRFVLTGVEGLGKSTFMRQVAICASAGLHPITFAPMAPLKVMVVDAENSEKQWRRKARSIAYAAKRYGSTDPTESMLVECVTRMDLSGTRDLAQIHAWIDEFSPDLMLIGPLYKLVPRAINSDDDAAPLIDALDSIRGRGIALLMEAHAGHSMTKGGDRDMRPRGSAALLGWPEFGYGLAVDAEYDPSGSTVRLVRWRGDRDERAWPERLTRGRVWPWHDVDPEGTAREYRKATTPMREVQDYDDRRAGA